MGLHLIMTQNFIIKAIRSTVFYVGYSMIMIALGLYARFINQNKFNGEQIYHKLVKFNRIIIGWARISCGIRYEVSGLENFSQPPYVIVSNHQSAWETYYFNIIFAPLTSVVKQELIDIPFFGRALKLVSPIAIDRNNPAKSLKNLIQNGIKSLALGRSILIFPEGTRVRKNKTVEYNAGGIMLAMKSGQSILPVAHNAGDFWPAGAPLKTPGIVKVVIGHPISTENKKRNEILAETETWIRNTLDDMKKP